eukprot:767400-Hanusia_phi.AAC.4
MQHWEESQRERRNRDKERRARTRRDGTETRRDGLGQEETGQRQGRKVGECEREQRRGQELQRIREK